MTFVLRELISYSQSDILNSDASGKIAHNHIRDKSILSLCFLCQTTFPIPICLGIVSFFKRYNKMDICMLTKGDHMNKVTSKTPT